MKPDEPSPQTVLAAVVQESRSELQLNHPDYRRVCLMFADGLEAMLAAAAPEDAPHIYSEVRTRNSKPKRKKPE